MDIEEQVSLLQAIADKMHERGFLFPRASAELTATLTSNIGTFAGSVSYVVRGKRVHHKTDFYKDPYACLSDLDTLAATLALPDKNAV